MSRSMSLYHPTLLYMSSFPLKNALHLPCTNQVVVITYPNKDWRLAMIGGSVVKSSGNSGGEQQQGQSQFSTGGNHQIWTTKGAAVLGATSCKAEAVESVTSGVWSLVQFLSKRGLSTINSSTGDWGKMKASTLDTEPDRTMPTYLCHFKKIWQYIAFPNLLIPTTLDG